MLTSRSTTLTSGVSHECFHPPVLCPHGLRRSVHLHQRHHVVGEPVGRPRPHAWFNRPCVSVPLRYGLPHAETCERGHVSHGDARRHLLRNAVLRHVQANRRTALRRLRMAGSDPLCRFGRPDDAKHCTRTASLNHNLANGNPVSAGFFISVLF